MTVIIVINQFGFYVHLGLFCLFYLHFHIVVIDWITLIVCSVVENVVFRLNNLLVYFRFYCVRIYFNIFVRCSSRRVCSWWWWRWRRLAKNQTLFALFTPLFKFFLLKWDIHLLKLQIFYACLLLSSVKLYLLFAFISKIIFNFGGFYLASSELFFIIIIDHLREINLCRHILWRLCANPIFEEVKWIGVIIAKGILNKQHLSTGSIISFFLTTNGACAW
jgi:hypothetical protein